MSDNESTIAAAGGGVVRGWTLQEKMNICLQAFQQLTSKDPNFSIAHKDILIDNRGSEGVRKTWYSILKEAKEYSAENAKPAIPVPRKPVKKLGTVRVKIRTVATSAKSKKVETPKKGFKLSLKAMTMPKPQSEQERENNDNSGATSEEEPSPANPSDTIKKTQAEASKGKLEQESYDSDDSPAANESSAPAAPQSVANGRNDSILKNKEEDVNSGEDSDDGIVPGSTAAAKVTASKKRKRSANSVSSAASVDDENDDIDPTEVARRVASILSKPKPS